MGLLVGAPLYYSSVPKNGCPVVSDFKSVLRQLSCSYAQIYLHRDIRYLARDVDVVLNIAKSFQTFGIIYLLEPYHTNATKRYADILGRVFVASESFIHSNIYFASNFPFSSHARSNHHKYQLRASSRVHAT